MTRYDCPQCGNGKLKREAGMWRCNGLMDPDNNALPLQACDFSCETLPKAPTPKIAANGPTSRAYSVLLVEAGHMSKRQTTAMWDYIDEVRAERDAYKATLQQLAQAPEGGMARATLAAAVQAFPQ
jgi:hypothetical protein